LENDCRKLAAVAAAAERIADQVAATDEIDSVV
jgi:hypothetical protein